MTHEENVALERIVGRLEHAVATLETRVPALGDTMERNRLTQMGECARHWTITNSLVSDMAAAASARKALEDEAKSARETVLAEAAAAATRIAREAAAGAEATAIREAVVAEAVTAVAKATRETLAAANTEKRTQRHWIIERVVPFLVPAATAIGAWLIAKGG